PSRERRRSPTTRLRSPGPGRRDPALGRALASPPAGLERTPHASQQAIIECTARDIIRIGIVWSCLGAVGPDSAARFHPARSLGPGPLRSREEVASRVARRRWRRRGQLGGSDAPGFRFVPPDFWPARPGVWLPSRREEAAGGDAGGDLRTRRAAECRSR